MFEIMIIRPEKEIGMGCCGGVCSDPDGLVHMEEEFKHHDEDRRRLGVLYQKTMEEYEDVHISYLDPRNLLAIAAYFFKHIKRGNVPLLKALHSMLFHMKYYAVFIDGKYVKNESEYKLMLQT
ncbi:hypothetical protein [Halobacillus litoralis]|uniref:Uncharacterized protein n=1 Tax=Halobacillus litoralis TaxID=45668 RepID=A0A410MG74_9BACI|nr:hypothetical protein [Halobacillus litoralis]QAS53665.1 hypothetical protein HLI_16375 [Halobacillus litoralis]